MPISNNQIKQFEDWIAKGKTKEVISDLLLIRDTTQYKSEIILLSNKWKGLEQQKMSNAISFNDYAIEEGKINNAILLLLDYLKNEEKGSRKVHIPGLSDDQPNALSTGELFQLALRKYLPVVFSALITGLVVWLIMGLKHENSFIQNCNDGGLNTNGEWNVRWTSEGEKLFGKAYIQQDSCYQNFSVSCEFQVKEGGDDLLTFNSKIGGYHESEIYFVYENSDGEKGVCSGELVDANIASFYVKCVDLVVGADPSNGSTGLIYFSSEEIKK